jgi:hypothetical protein
MRTWMIAAVGCGLCVVGCFGQVADGGASGNPSPATTNTATTSPPSPPQSPPSVSPPESGPDPAPVDSGVVMNCVSDAGTTCNLPDGTACTGDQDCASGVCYGDSVSGGHCSEFCTATNAASVCTFGAKKCGTSGMCVVTCTGGTCSLADGQACNGDDECASNICFANGSAFGGTCTESCTAANEKTVCTFGQHKCDPDMGYCL